MDALNAQSVEMETARVYEERMANGGAVILARAGYQPLSVPNTRREVMAEMGGADLGSLTEEVYVKDLLRPMLSILADHPLMLSRPSDPTSSSFPMADWPIPLISRRNPYTGSLIGRHGRMANLPFPLLVNGTRGTNSLLPHGPRMANFPISLPSRCKPFAGSIFRRHARMANFPISLIRKRKPLLFRPFHAMPGWLISHGHC